MQDRLFRALAILRVVLIANTIGLNFLRRENFEPPTAGLLVVLCLAVWTGVAIWAYADPARRTPPLLVTDLLVAVAGLAVTPWVKGPDFNATVAGFWVMGAMFAWAIQWRWAGGLTAAVVLCAADLAIRDTFTQLDGAEFVKAVTTASAHVNTTSRTSRSMLCQPATNRAILAGM